MDEETEAAAAVDKETEAVAAAQPAAAARRHTTTSALSMTATDRNSTARGTSGRSRTTANGRADDRIMFDRSTSDNNTDGRTNSRE